MNWRLSRFTSALYVPTRTRLSLVGCGADQTVSRLQPFFALTVAALRYNGGFHMRKGQADRPPASREPSASRSGAAPARTPVSDWAGYFPSPELDQQFPPFADLQKALGFVPGLFRAQTLLPRAIEAEVRITQSVRFTEKALSRAQKECLILAVAAASRNTYCVTGHARALEALGVSPEVIDDVATDFRHAQLPAKDVGLLGFGLKLSRHPTWIGTTDIDSLRTLGFADDAILEAVLVTALTQFLCTLSTGLGVRPDYESRMTFPTDETLAAWTRDATPPVAPAGDRGIPYLHAEPKDPATFAPFKFFLESFGFVPNLFRAQTLRADVLDAEAFAVGTVLLAENLLTRKQKESIFLVVSAANLNTYCVAVHCEFLRALGVPVESSDQIAVDHHQAGLTDADCALLDVTLKLATRHAEFGQADIDLLAQHGWSSEQTLEAVVLTALVNFMNTAQMGLATHPDVTPPRRFPIEPNPTTGDDREEPVEGVKPKSAEAHPIDTSVRPAIGDRPRGADDDGELVVKAQAGDLGAFEQLVQRHTRRVYRAIASIVGSQGDAEDAVQETFLKVFRHLSRFQGGSRFSTWVTRIAINEGLQQLRRRKPSESLDDTPEDQQFRPRNVQAWSDDPERLFAREETRTLVRNALEEIPLPYRVVLTLQEIEGLPVAEVAEALGLSGGRGQSRPPRKAHAA